MTNRSPQRLGLSALNGLIALGIVTWGILYADHRVDRLTSIFTANIRFVDAAFGIFFVLAWQYCFSVFNLYDKFANMQSRMLTILKAVVTMTLLLIGHLLLFHRNALNIRAVVIVTVALFAYEVDRVAFGDWFIDRIAARNPQRVIILGSGRRAGKAWREIRTRYHYSISLLGFVDDRSESEMAPDVAARYIGNVDSLNRILLNEPVDMILVAMPIQSCYSIMQRSISIAENVGVQVIYLEDIYATRKKHGDVNSVVFRELVPQHEHYITRLAVKRLVDIFGAMVGLILLSPLILCVALGVKLTSRGPIFFAQERYGHRRRRFKMYKFRSMVDNAEELLKSLESSNEASGPIFKMRNDPRITRFGKFLRTTSLDELPQLWNVLIGDMSLVGPRPMSVRDVSLFSEAMLMRRFSVKPGITGLWQVSGRSGVSFDKWVEWDFHYIDRWSLALDFKIMARTVGAVLRRSGAM